MLKGANIVLGVTGGIAAYKAVELCSRLVQAGASVDVIMTPAATHFVTPLPFQTLTAHPVSVDQFQLLRDMDMAHIELSKKAQVLVIAPATANTMAKMALGLADNLLTSTALATTAPLVIAPAMDADMWASPATQANAETLRQRGAVLVGPGRGRLASGRMGLGRLVSVEEIVAAIRATLGRNGPLAGLKVLVTAGGTQETLDPVRYLTNRSSGKMGYAVAEAARDAGAHVTLVSAPTGLPQPFGIDYVAVRTAADMHAAVLARTDETDVLIMSAAVADYRPAQVSEHKIKKSEGGLALPLERTIDILQAVAGVREATERPGLVVGFAAETENLLANAHDKLTRKRMDLIVANDVSASDSGFEVDTNRVTLLAPERAPEALPLMSKAEVAEQLVLRIADLWRARHG
ncbi:MAG: bifunctional phosphopantothenoylcysteine decarboxylase/phosphopantothenate--cysteine ligase CoaBC [Chloroflexi bacterium]|nr:bifunctional phosphopantothenoylcysteine decarboxylase/phosphopantothenate--cysteine ligase CoaBC [Chloroflexota bacterium]